MLCVIVTNGNCRYGRGRAKYEECRKQRTNKNNANGKHQVVIENNTRKSQQRVNDVTNKRRVTGIKESMKRDKWPAWLRPQTSDYRSKDEFYNEMETSAKN